MYRTNKYGSLLLEKAVIKIGVNTHKTAKARVSNESSSPHIDSPVATSLQRVYLVPRILLCFHFPFELRLT